MMNINAKSLKPKNLVAKDLRSPKYRMRVVDVKKRYKRINYLKDVYND